MSARLACALLLFAHAALAAPSPRVDHHQHLVSPAGAAWLNRPPALAEPLPADVATLLRAREQAWNDAAALEPLYTRDARAFDVDTPAWLRGPREIGAYYGRRFRAPYRLVPTAFDGGERLAQLAGVYARGEGDALQQIGRFTLTIARAPGGAARIALEAPSFPGPVPEAQIDGAQLVAMLDEAGIARAVVLSDAYWLDGRREPDDEATVARMRAENDWTAAQAALHPTRLVAFCSFNPLRRHAQSELRRCARSGAFAGVKLHFGVSGVDLRDPAHVAAVRRVFVRANRVRLPLVVHVRADESYGAAHARTFLSLVADAPDVVVQVAHLWGGENYSDEALAVYAEAVAARAPGTARLYFDLTDAALAADASSEAAPRIVAHMRTIGMDRLLYGSDAAMGTHPRPREAWAQLASELPLTAAELAQIAANVAPYLQRN